MAKKDKAAKPGRIPKKIGGVKLTKGLRKSGERLIERAGTPEGRRMIAAGLAMASAAIARAKDSSTRPVPPTPPVPLTPPVPPIPPVPPVPPRATQSAEGVPPSPAPPEPPVSPAPDGMGTPMVDPAAIADAVGKAATAFIDGFFNRRR